MYVYRQNDLQALQDEMEQFWRAALRFNSYLRNPIGAHEAKEFRQVQELPLIKAALAP